MRKDLPEVEGMTPLNEIDPAVRAKIDTWNLAPSPSLPLEDEFDEVKAYTVAGTGGIPLDALKYMEEMAVTLKSKRFRVRLEGNPHDNLSQTAYDASEGMKVIFKSSPNYGDPDHKNYMGEFKRPSYEAHAITSLLYNMEAIQFKRKQGFNMGAKKEKIMESTMTDQEKIMAIARLISEKNSQGTNIRTFGLLEPSKRKRLAVKAHLLLGAGCTEPVRFLIICTPDGAKTPEEVNANEDPSPENTSRYIGQIIYMAYYLDIPIFNINKDEDRKALTKLVETF